ncbi:MAG: 5,10-methylenetetrahydromethanopterin reductase [Candidatus Bathyarchaeia archaeon]
MVEFGLLMAPKWPLQEIVKIYSYAEKLGIQYGWIADYANSVNPYLALTALAFNTKKMKLGTGVTNPYTRNPCIIASTIATIDETSNGRAILGIGAGDETLLKSAGIIRKSPSIMLRESVEVIKLILKGEPVNYSGKMIKLSGFTLMFKPKRVVPIYIGARSPKMLQLAGEIGDGVLLDLSHHFEVKLSLDEVKKGVEKARKKISDIDLATAVLFGISKKEEEAWNSVRWCVALIAVSTSPKVLERHGISFDDTKKVKEALEKGGLSQAEPLVTEEMLEAFSISGKPEYCVERIEELVKVGLNQINLAIIDFNLENIPKHLELFHKEVKPHFE